LKLCFTCGSFTTEGGASKFSVNLVKKLSVRHDITLVTKVYKVPVEGIKVVTYETMKFPASAEVLSTADNATRIVMNLDRNEYFDVIHGQGEMLFQDVLSVHGCHRSWVADIRKERGIGYDLLSRMHPATRAVLQIEKKIYRERLYERIVAISGQVRNDLIKYYKVPENDITVIHNGLDFREFNLSKEKRLSARNYVRKRYGIKDENVLLFVGQSFYKKGLGEIIHAL
jgi:UDP-glucose:(heptosyl)LPS alpha-1,3-glucosyltransferase